MSVDEETNLNKVDNIKLNVVEEIQKLFTNNIQKDYISKYTPYENMIDKNIIDEDIIDEYKDTSFPQTKSYKKLKDNFSNYNQKILDLYDIDSINKKKLTNNICEVNSKNINCYIGNVNLQQLSNGFRNGFENALISLDNDTTINKPFGKGKLDLLKYMSIMASRDKSALNNYDAYLKNQIGKDVLDRDVFLINDEFILETMKQNKTFGNALKKNKLINSDKTNIIALYILRELFNKTNSKYTEEQMYDILMTILPLLHQGLHGEIQILLNDYINKIIDEINDPNLYLLNITLPKSNDDKINYEEYKKSNKYLKLIINENEISIYSVMYSKFVFAGNIDPFTDGHFFSVLHIDILNKTYEIKYLTLDINYKNIEYLSPNNLSPNNLSPNNLSPNELSSTKFDKIKENVSYNKSSVAIGTLLTLGALSAIPIALLLGGKRTKRRLMKEKRRKNKTHRRKQIKTRNKKYNYKNNKNNKNNKKRRTMRY